MTRKTVSKDPRSSQYEAQARKPEYNHLDDTTIRYDLERESFCTVVWKSGTEENVLSRYTQLHSYAPYGLQTIVNCPRARCLLSSYSSPIPCSSSSSSDPDPETLIQTCAIFTTATIPAGTFHDGFSTLQLTNLFLNIISKRSASTCVSFIASNLLSVFSILCCKVRSFSERIGWVARNTDSLRYLLMGNDTRTR